MRKFILMLIIMSVSYLQAQTILFIRGGTGTVGHLEGGGDDHAADITDYHTNNGNHGWGQLADALRGEGFTCVQMQEGPSNNNTPINLQGINLSQYALIVFGSNNAAYGTAAVDAVDSYVRNGGSVLYISDTNFGRDWRDASDSDQHFLDRWGWTMNQDKGFYTISQSDYVVPGHEIFSGVSSFEGEGVTPITVNNYNYNGVSSTILARAEGVVRRNTGSNQGPTTNATQHDAALVVATLGQGKIAGHFDRNTFFNDNGAGTWLEKSNQDNREYAINLFTWLVGDGNGGGGGGDSWNPQGNPAQATTGYGGVPSRALDGNTNGSWSGGSVTHTDGNTANPWWYYDLGSSKDVASIKVYNRTENSNRLSGFKLYVSTSQYTSEDMSTTQNQSGVTTYSGPSNMNGVASHTFTINKNVRYVRIQRSGSAALSLAEVVVTENSGGGGGGGGDEVAIPAKIEAEDFVDANETSSGNSGNCASSSVNGNVDIQSTSDTGGGCNIGWTTSGEWLEYAIDAGSGGNFDINLRLASSQSGKTVNVKLDGSSIGSLTSPSNGWQSFANRTLSGVSIGSGSHTIRVEMTTGNVNFNYLDIQSNGGGGGGSVSWNENFSHSNGTTSDNGSTSWNATRSSGTFNIDGNRLKVNGAGSEGVLTTGVIDISGGTVGVSLDVVSVGNLENNQDYVRLYKKVNGGAEVLIGQKVGIQSATTISGSGISGNTLQLVIRAYVSAGSENYFMDNLNVSSGLGKKAVEKDFADIVASGLAINSLGAQGLEFNLPQEGLYTLSMFTLSGQRVLSDIQAFGQAGVNWVSVAGHDLRDGVYFVRLSTAGETTSKKVTRMLEKK